MTIATLIWPYVERSIEAQVVAFEELDPAGRSWRPPAPETNSMATLVNHTIANAEENLLGTICGEAVAYDREADFDAPSTDPDAVRERWERLRTGFQSHLTSLTDEHLLETIEHPRRGAVTRLEVLVVVARHAAEHLAHAELTRDLYDAREGGLS